MLRQALSRCLPPLATAQRAATQLLQEAQPHHQSPHNPPPTPWDLVSRPHGLSTLPPAQQPGASSPDPTSQQPGTSGRSTGAAGPHQPQKHVVYQGRWITPFRLLVRGKIFQLFGVAGASIAVAAVITTEDISAVEAFWLAALGLGAAGGSACLWYYSRRYVGELSLLLPHARTARFSTLDFWGNRQDTDVPVESIRPPFKNLSEAAVRKLTRSPLFPVDVEGDRQYYISVHSARIFDKKTLMQLLEGTYVPGAFRVEQEEGSDNAAKSAGPESN